jgi:hypothetical protein
LHPDPDSAKKCSLRIRLSTEVNSDQQSCIQVGREFIGDGGGVIIAAGDTLQESLQKQCLAYFNAYHTSRLDELKTHLENESWTLCPVKPTFSLRSLAEFAHLRQLGGAGGGKLLTPSKKRSLIMQQSGGGGAVRTYFAEFWEGGGTPFDDALHDASYEEDILMEYSNSINNNSASRQENNESEDEEDDLSEEQKLEILQENEGDHNNHGVLTTLRSNAPPPTAALRPPPPKSGGLCLANTTLMLLRLVGRYTHLARLLHPVAGEILRGMAQIVHYYVYTVHAFFVDSGEAGGEGGGEQLKQFVSSVYAAVIRHEVVVMTSSPVTSSPVTSSPAAVEESGGAGDQQQLSRQLVGLVPRPEISPIVDLNR